MMNEGRYRCEMYATGILARNFEAYVMACAAHVDEISCNERPREEWAEMEGGGRDGGVYRSRLEWLVPS